MFVKKETSINVINALGDYLAARDAGHATEGDMRALREAYDDITIADLPTFDKAVELYCDSDDVGIDANPLTSESDDGAWVQAWVWVGK